MASGQDGQFLKLDRNGTVIGAVGRGMGIEQGMFTEASYWVFDRQNNMYAGDTSVGAGDEDDRAPIAGQIRGCARQLSQPMRKGGPASSFRLSWESSPNRLSLGRRPRNRLGGCSSTD